MGYNKKDFGGRIKQFIDDIIKEAWKSQYELYYYHWKVHSPLVEEITNPPYELFHDSFVITFTQE